MKKDRNYIKYRQFVLDNFRQFLNGVIDSHTLNQNLHTIQTKLGFQRQRGMKCVWFMFNDKDGGTINRITSDLKFADKDKRTQLKKNMQLVIDNPKELKIYYS
jgi:hypothetical protein